MPTIARGLGKNAQMPNFRICDYLGDPEKITRLKLALLLLTCLLFRDYYICWATRLM